MHSGCVVYGDVVCALHACTLPHVCAFGTPTGLLPHTRAWCEVAVAATQLQQPSTARTHCQVGSRAGCPCRVGAGAWFIGLGLLHCTTVLWCPVQSARSPTTPLMLGVLQYNSTGVRDSFEEPDYSMVDTLFSLAEAYLFCQLVELVVSQLEGHSSPVKEPGYGNQMLHHLSARVL